MTFKTLLFCLFLYVCLVWVGAFYFYSGQDTIRIGLLWTGGGIAAVLAFIILSRLWGWGRTLRARAAAKPKPALKRTQPVNEDEAAIAALINEANATLRRAAGYSAEKGEAPLSKLPLYLLIGPEGSGKTSTFFNSGLEPQLLAGEAVAPPFLSTRLCNFWLAKNALFVEIGGRAFSGDPNRWQLILRSLQAKPPAAGWKRFWSGPEKAFDLRGVIAFCDVKDFTAALSPQGRERLDRQSNDWQDRLGAIAETFKASVPVYFLITKCDALPYFSDYFRGLPDSEANQVLGCTLADSKKPDAAADGTSVEAEAKRLTKSFGVLYHSLAERRIWHLSHEPDPARRPAIYEFPRELKRIRPVIVQFLSSTFRSHPLRVDPMLRGYYFSATGERPAAAQDLSESRAQRPDSSAVLEATALFRADATQIFRPSEASAGPKLVFPRGVTHRWLFVSELLNKVVLAERSTGVPARLDTRVERKRMVACAAVCALCLLLCFAFLNSWTRNRHLLNAVSESAELQNRGTTPTLAELQSLDNLRGAAGQLLEYDHEGAPLGMRWGLYSGSRIARAARDLYFRRFQDLLLNPLNAVITAHLQNLPASPGPDAPYNPVLRLLQTHLMISSAVCTPDPILVSEGLKGALQEIVPAGTSPMWQSLAGQQIDFYTGELRYGNPCKLAENTAARDRARQYLAQIHGADRIYASVLAAGEKSFTKAQRLGDLSSDYAVVLSGPGEVSGIFSRDGWTYIEKASKKSTGDAPGDACALGQGNSLFGRERTPDAGVERAIQRLYIRDYAEHWRRFVTAFSVKGYGGVGDAARKLEMLSDHKSPLLALFAMTSNQTNFPQTAAEPEGLEKGKAVVKRFFPSLGNQAKIPGASPNAVGSPAEPLSTIAGITRSFQPVHWVVPPASDTWVNDKNGAYIDALAQLGNSMRDIERGGASTDQAIFQTASQNYDKALEAARQIARGFEPQGVEGLDGAVERLLEEPIRQAQRFIVTDVEGAAAGKVNGQLRGLCVRVRNTLRKYPFSPSGEDASLQEVSDLFGPGTGAVWKFQADSLGDFVVKDGKQWKAKDPTKKPQVTQEILTFLNRAQAIADAFYPVGANQPHFTYTLRPKLDASYKDDVLELEIDGQAYPWTTSIQKAFTWPSPGTGKTGVIGRIKIGSVAFPFASRGGIWGIFRVMGDAEPRPLDSKLVEWKYVRGGDGRMEPITPAPVRLEIVDFPGGVDLFNPKFFQGLQCPIKAVQ
ncbi:MAG: type VI secretion system membrane subunit TssM [Bryobacteraceae bacterium]